MQAAATFSLHVHEPIGSRNLITHCNSRNIDCYCAIGGCAKILYLCTLRTIKHDNESIAISLSVCLFGRSHILKTTSKLNGIFCVVLTVAVALFPPTTMQ